MRKERCDKCEHWVWKLSGLEIGNFPDIGECSLTNPAKAKYADDSCSEFQIKVRACPELLENKQ